MSSIMCSTLHICVIGDKPSNYYINKYNVEANLDASDNVISGYECSPEIILTSQSQKLA